MERSNYKPKNKFSEAGAFLRENLDLENFEKALTGFFEREDMTEDEQNLFSYYLTTQLQVTLAMAKVKVASKKVGENNAAQ